MNNSKYPNTPILIGNNNVLYNFLKKHINNNPIKNELRKLNYKINEMKHTSNTSNKIEFISYINNFIDKNKFDSRIFREFSKPQYVLILNNINFFENIIGEQKNIINQEYQNRFINLFNTINNYTIIFIPLIVFGSIINEKIIFFTRHLLYEIIINNNNKFKINNYDELIQNFFELEDNNFLDNTYKCQVISSEINYKDKNLNENKSQIIITYNIEDTYNFIGSIQFIIDVNYNDNTFNININLNNIINKLYYFQKVLCIDDSYNFKNLILNYYKNNVKINNNILIIDYDEETALFDQYDDYKPIIYRVITEEPEIIVVCTQYKKRGRITNVTNNYQELLQKNLIKLNYVLKYKEQKQGIFDSNYNLRTRIYYNANGKCKINICKEDINYKQKNGLCTELSFTKNNLPYKYIIFNLYNKSVNNNKKKLDELKNIFIYLKEYYDKKYNILICGNTNIYTQVNNYSNIDEFLSKSIIDKENIFNKLTNVKNYSDYFNIILSNNKYKYITSKYNINNLSNEIDYFSNKLKYFYKFKNSIDLKLNPSYINSAIQILYSINEYRKFILSTNLSTNIEKFLKLYSTNKSINGDKFINFLDNFKLILHYFNCIKDNKNITKKFVLKYDEQKINNSLDPINIIQYFIKSLTRFNNICCFFSLNYKINKIENIKNINIPEYNKYLFIQITDKENKESISNNYHMLDISNNKYFLIGIILKKDTEYIYVTYQYYTKIHKVYTNNEVLDNIPKKFADIQNNCYILLYKKYDKDDIETVNHMIYNYPSIIDYKKDNTYAYLPSFTDRIIYYSKNDMSNNSNNQNYNMYLVPDKSSHKMLTMSLNLSEELNNNNNNPNFYIKTYNCNNLLSKIYDKKFDVDFYSDINKHIKKFIDNSVRGSKKTAYVMKINNKIFLKKINDIEPTEKVELNSVYLNRNTNNGYIYTIFDKLKRKIDENIDEKIIFNIILLHRQDIMTRLSYYINFCTMIYIINILDKKFKSFIEVLNSYTLLEYHTSRLYASYKEKLEKKINNHIPNEKLIQFNFNVDTTKKEVIIYYDFMQTLANADKTYNLFNYKLYVTYFYLTNKITIKYTFDNDLIYKKTNYFLDKIQKNNLTKCIRSSLFSKKICSSENIAIQYNKLNNKVENNFVIMSYNEKDKKNDYTDKDYIHLLSRLKEEPYFIAICTQESKIGGNNYMLKLDKLLELYGYNKLFNTNDSKGTLNRLSKSFTYKRSLMMGLYYNKNSVIENLDNNKKTKDKKCSITEHYLQKNEKSIFLSLKFNNNGQEYEIIVVNSGQNNFKTIIDNFHLTNNDNVFVCSNIKNLKKNNNSNSLYNNLIDSYSIIYMQYPKQNGGGFSLRKTIGNIGKIFTRDKSKSSPYKSLKTNNHVLKMPEQKQTQSQKQTQVQVQSKIEAKSQTNTQPESKKNVSEKILFSLSEYENIEKITNSNFKMINSNMIFLSLKILNQKEILIEKNRQSALRIQKIWEENTSNNFLPYVSQYQSMKKEVLSTQTLEQNILEAQNTRRIINNENRNPLEENNENRNRREENEENNVDYLNNNFSYFST